MNPFQAVLQVEMVTDTFVDPVKHWAAWLTLQPRSQLTRLFRAFCATSAQTVLESALDSTGHCTRKVGDSLMRRGLAVLDPSQRITEHHRLVRV